MSGRRTFERGSSGAHADERGISLSELIIAMGVFGVISLMVVTLFMSTTNAATQTRSLSQDTRTANNAMSEVARMIRAATENPVQNPPTGSPTTDPAIESASAKALTIFAYVNLESATQTPVKVRFWVNTKSLLIETRWPATTLVDGHWSFASSPLPDRVLGGPLTNPDAVFTFYQGDSKVVDASGGLSGAAAVDKLRTIKAVKVTISVRSRPDGPAVTLQNTVAMPNLGLTRTGEATL